MEKQDRISRKKQAASTTQGRRAAVEREAPVIREVSAAPEMLDMNRYIRRLVQSISPALKKRIRLREKIGGDALPVTVSPARITTIFAVLVACAMRLAPGGRITVFTALQPVDAGPAAGAAGTVCALLSFRATGKKNQGIAELSVLGRDRMLPALFTVRQMVARDHGCFRLCAGENSMAFNVYLPVARQSSVPMTQAKAALAVEKEGEPWTSRSYERA